MLKILSGSHLIGASEQITALCTQRKCLFCAAAEIWKGWKVAVLIVETCTLTSHRYGQLIRFGSSAWRFCFLWPAYCVLLWSTSKSLPFQQNVQLVKLFEISDNFPCLALKIVGKILHFTKFRCVQKEKNLFRIGRWHSPGSRKRLWCSKPVPFWRIVFHSIILVISDDMRWIQPKWSKHELHSNSQFWNFSTEKPVPKPKGYFKHMRKVRIFLQYNCKQQSRNFKKNKTRSMHPVEKVSKCLLMNFTFPASILKVAKQNKATKTWEKGHFLQFFFPLLIFLLLSNLLWVHIKYFDCFLFLFQAQTPPFKMENVLLPKSVLRSWPVPWPTGHPESGWWSRSQPSRCCWWFKNQ